MGVRQEKTLKKSHMKKFFLNIYITIQERSNIVLFLYKINVFSTDCLTAYRMKHLFRPEELDPPFSFSFSSSIFMISRTTS